MEWFDQSLLSIILFFPVVWGVLTLLVPEKTSKHWALIGTLISFGLSLLLLDRFDSGSGEFQLLESAPWIPQLGISYLLGIDGISLWLVILSTFLGPLVVLSSYESVHSREKEYYFLLLALQSGMLGAFMALDTFLFYVFWEAMLIPMYLLIGIWGGKERIYASMKFFLYTVVGSLLMLVAIFYLSHLHLNQFGVYSMSLVDLLRVRVPHGSWFGPQELLFLAFALAFAIKVPLFPFHTWLPDAHVQAPTAGSVILAGVLLKLGGYGFLRFAIPLFPSAALTFQKPILVLSAIAIVYGAWVATVQTDVKKLVAYSSVSHMGYIMLGVFSLNSIALNGAVYQMLNHGISTGGLFLLVGMIYDRRHTREIAELNGLSRVMPMFAIAFLIITLSSIALPGTNGFVGEFLILLGAWKANKWVTLAGGLGVIFGAVYMLWMFQRVMFGPVKNDENKSLVDLSGREFGVIVPMIILVFVMGVFPNYFMRGMSPALEKVLARVNSVLIAEQPETAAAEPVNSNEGSDDHEHDDSST